LVGRKQIKLFQSEGQTHRLVERRTNKGTEAYKTAGHGKYE